MGIRRVINIKVLCFLHMLSLTLTFATLASWYGLPYHGRLTASGEVFNMNSMTAAHRTLPFGTRLRVCNKRNTKCTTVRINDRGPFIFDRELDLSRAAARAIGLESQGVGPVTITPLK